MFLSNLSRQNNLSSNFSLSRALIVTLSTRRRLSSSSSNLYERYSFQPPPSLSTPIRKSPRNTPSPKPSPPKPDKGLTKRERHRHRPPVSLEGDGASPRRRRSDLPFDFRFSYTESSPTVRPIGLREPKYSPFGPGRLDRKWTGVCAPAVDRRVRSAEGDDRAAEAEEAMAEKRRNIRERTQGEELTTAERTYLVESCKKAKTKSQINLGRDGLTHNMLNEIQNHWKFAEAVRIKCLGVPTVDMKNIITQLEDKTSGKVIHKQSGMLILYRGRVYNRRKRPFIPLMLWKPQEPIYPKLIKTTIDGLSKEETKEMRKRGLLVPALTKLAKNGYYGNLVTMVRDAFLVTDLIRIDCQGLEKSDYKKIGVKLRELVPCTLVTFEKEQIVVWRGKDYKPPENFLSDSSDSDSDSVDEADMVSTDHLNINDT